MSIGYTASDIITGAEVFGADGDKVGTVAAVYPGYIVVEKGFFFPTDYYIPMSAVACYDTDRVYAERGQGCGPQPRLGCPAHRSGDRQLRTATDIDHRHAHRHRSGPPRGEPRWRRMRRSASRSSRRN